LRSGSDGAELGVKRACPLRVDTRLAPDRLLDF
jgi:hypothetical protein